MITNKVTCVITFDTSLGKKKVVRYKDARPNISPTQIRNAGNHLINANPFDTSVGTLLTGFRGEVVRETIERLL